MEARLEPELQAKRRRPAYVPESRGSDPEADTGGVGSVFPARGAARAPGGQGALAAPAVEARRPGFRHPSPELSRMAGAGPSGPDAAGTEG